jgi:hypothetical protein
VGVEKEDPTAAGGLYSQKYSHIVTLFSKYTRALTFQNFCQARVVLRRGAQPPRRWRLALWRVEIRVRGLGLRRFIWSGNVRHCWRR